MSTQSKPSELSRQSGLSLVEIMVALVSGLILVAGIGQVYLSNRQSNRGEDAQSSLRENARFAMALVARSVQEAGYLSCSNSVPLSNVMRLNPATNLHDYTFDYQYETFNYTADTRFNSISAIQGADWNGGVQSVAFPTDWIPYLDPSIVEPSPGSDILTIRGPLGPDMPLAAPATGAASVSVEYPHNERDIPRLCDIVMVSNCLSATVFQVTGVNTDASGNITLDHIATAPPGPCTGPTGAIVQPGNTTGSLTLPNATPPNAYRIGDGALAYGTTTYYLSKTPDNNSPACNTSLFRQVNGKNREELAQGVEEMQILYGEDTDPLPLPADRPDLTPNRYVTARDVGDWRRVLSVRVSLLLCTPEDGVATAPQTYDFNFGALLEHRTAEDRRLRYVFTRTIGIRNRLP